MPSLPDKLRIAVIQWDIKTDQPEPNLHTCAQLVRQAAGLSAHLAVFPEMWTRSFCDHQLFNEARCYSNRLDFCRNLAVQNRIWLGAGTIPEPAEPHEPEVQKERGNSKDQGSPCPACLGNLKYPECPERVYNTFHLISPDGEIRLKYRKIHLFPNTGEPRFFLAGSTIPTPAVAGNWVVGAGICYDLRFPELFRPQMKQGANLFLVPAQFPRPREAHFTLLAKARAMENQAGLVAVNRSGATPTLQFPGNSMFLDFWGNPLCEMTGEDGCAVAELDFAQLATARRDFPFIQDTPLL
jgi:predicted amidohydrolase